MLYTIVLNSNQYYGSSAPTNTANVSYFIDWSTLKNDSAYKMRMFFNSREFGSADANSVYLVNADFVSGSNTIQSIRNNQGVIGSDFIGMIHPETVSRGGNDTVHLQAHSVDSAYIYLNNRPSNSLITISIRNMDGTTPNLSTLQYTLVLQLEEV
jgi:hypothetical protein